MTGRGVGPCSPAERGTSCNGLCCAPTGALWRETSSFDPHPGTPDGVDPSTGKRSAGKLARCVWTGGKGVSPYLSVPLITISLSLFCNQCLEMQGGRLLF